MKLPKDLFVIILSFRTEKENMRSFNFIMWRVFYKYITQRHEYISNLMITCSHTGKKINKYKTYKSLNLISRWLKGTNKQTKKYIDRDINWWLLRNYNDWRNNDDYDYGEKHFINNCFFSGCECNDCYRKINEYESDKLWLRPHRQILIS